MSNPKTNMRHQNRQAQFNRGSKKKDSRKEEPANSSYSEKETAVPQILTKFKPLTENQALMGKSIDENTCTIAVGPPGTGKTAVAILKAAEYLVSRKVNKIILTRANVEIGEKMGFLPGEVDDKFAPYLVPFIDCLNMALGKANVASKVGKSIIPIPVGFTQGQTWDNSFIIIDEAQNLKDNDLYILQTRIGKNSKLVILGDCKQIAQENLKGRNGLEKLLNRIEKRGVEVFRQGDQNIVSFDINDIVRDDYVARIVQLYMED